MDDYENFRRQYDHLQVNDGTAMPKVKELIALAKKEMTSKNWLGRMKMRSFIILIQKKN